MRLTTLLVLCSILAGCDQISTYVCEAVKESCQHVLPVYTGVPLERGGLLYVRIPVKLISDSGFS